MRFWERDNPWAGKQSATLPLNCVTSVCPCPAQSCRTSTGPCRAVTVILGPNGCGKSTLMRVITGYGHVTSGTVRVLGETLGKTQVHELRKRLGVYDPSLVRLQMPAPAPRSFVATGLFGHLTTYFDRPSPAQLRVAARPWPKSACGSGRVSRTNAVVGTTGPRVAGGPWCTCRNCCCWMSPPRRLISWRVRRCWPVSSRFQEPSSIEPHHGDAPFGRSSSGRDVVVLMSNGKIVAQGPPQEVLTSEVLSDAFRVSVTVACEHERWRWSVRPEVWRSLM